MTAIRPRSADGPLPIVVDQHLAMDATGTLRLVFDADPWDSTISFAPGIPVARGGTLELTFAADVNLASQIGRTIDLFDWTGVTPTGAFTVSSPYTWNLSKLYTTGEVTLTALAAIPGDFNNNGVVDAADYVVWRKTDGTPAGYNAWRTHFGQPSGSGAGAIANAAVPEPATLVLLMFAAAGWCLAGNAKNPNNSVRRESRRSPVGANPTRPIGRSAGSNQGDEGPDSEYQNSSTRDIPQQTTLVTHVILHRFSDILCGDAVFQYYCSRGILLTSAWPGETLIARCDKGIFQLSRNFRVRRYDILGFRRILAKVIQFVVHRCCPFPSCRLFGLSLVPHRFELGSVCPLDQFPITHANVVDRAGRLENYMVAHGCARLFLGKCAQHIETVLGISLRQWHVENARERGQHVREANHLVADCAGGSFAGPAHDKWFPESAFPFAVLAAAERTVNRKARLHCGRRILVARVHDSAIVARENDERVVGELELVELVQKLPDAPVEVVDKIAVFAVGTAGELRIRHDGFVNGVGRIVNEEWPVVIGVQSTRSCSSLTTP